MSSKNTKSIYARLAKVLTSACVRNTQLEDIHAGRTPVTKTGDYSDVKIIDADGNEIPWNEASHITNSQMKNLMKEIVNRVFTFLMQQSDPRFQAKMNFYETIAAKWDEPEIDTKLDCTKPPRDFDDFKP